MATLDGSVLLGIIAPFADGTLIGGRNGDVESLSFFDGIKEHDRSGDVFNLGECAGSTIPTGTATFSITKLSVTIYRLVYEITAVVVGGGADGNTTVSNATLLADSFGNGPLKEFILAPTYASSALALKGSASGNGETNIYGAVGSGATWSINALIDGSGKLTLVPAIYTLNDGTYAAIGEIIFRHSIIV